MAQKGSSTQPIPLDPLQQGGGSSSSTHLTRPNTPGDSGEGPSAQNRPPVTHVSPEGVSLSLTRVTRPSSLNLPPISTTGDNNSTGNASSVPRTTFPHATPNGEPDSSVQSTPLSPGTARSNEKGSVGDGIFIYTTSPISAQPSAPSIPSSPLTDNSNNGGNDRLPPQRDSEKAHLSQPPSGKRQRLSINPTPPETPSGLKPVAADAPHGRVNSVSASIRPDVPYEKRLFTYTVQSCDKEPGFKIFGNLQMLNIFRLQNELEILKQKFYREQQARSDDTKELTVLLHNYANAIRDYEDLQKLAPITGSQVEDTKFSLAQAFKSEYSTLIQEGEGGFRRFPDPTLLSTDPLRNFLKRHLHRRFTYTPGDKYKHAREYYAGDPPEDVSPGVDRLARFLVAILGVGMLVTPMFIMRLPDVSLLKSLVTVSVAELIFAGGLSMIFRATNTETLVATATYAAVLMVFVGVTN
ncbi:uncharacterized protein C8A04DRAFT_25916 [Dichotomopilus funicola]|uniref:DUF6594 domain-containing protein n=1 Tax=Dichotomopilus funicola TaxID=1934379 RepID=A0AAN6ZPI3_9PEZI|nr:hypothetical protein C8A04DRAFT_25916 [Dichotomopilus funicola]